MNIAASPFVEDAVREACGGSTEFAHPGGTAVRAVRRHYSRARVMGLPYVAEAHLLRQRFEAAAAVAAEVGAMSNQANAATDPMMEGNATGQFMMLGTAAAGGSMPLLERFAPGSPGKAIAGDFLVTHPLSCLSESVFDQAVLLLDAAEEETPSSVTGIVLNKPTGVMFGQMLERWQGTEDRQWINSIKSLDISGNQLFRGGPIIDGNSLKDSLRWLHVYGKDVEGAREVSPGVWIGGNLKEVVARAGGDAAGIRFFLGFAGWAPLQLAIELECGIWVHARAASSAPETRELCLSAAKCGEVWRLAMGCARMPMFAGFPRSPGVDRRLRGYMDRFNQQEMESRDNQNKDEGKGMKADAPERGSYSHRRGAGRRHK